MNITQLRMYIKECEIKYITSGESKLEALCSDLISKIDIKENKQKVTRKQRVVNKFNYKGKCLTMLELQSVSDFTQSTIISRIKKGWSVEDAVDKPSSTFNGVTKYYSYNGQILTMLELVSITGVSNTTINNRLNHGWTINEAIETPLGQNPEGSPMTANQVNSDHNKALKRDKKLLMEHQQFARCTARINSK